MAVFKPGQQTPFQASKPLDLPVAGAKKEEDPRIIEMEQQIATIEATAPETEKKRQLIDQLRQDAKAAYKDEGKRREWMEVAEKMGNALVQFGAAKSGGSRADMSQLNLAKTDWMGERDQDRQDYRMELDDLAAQAKLLPDNSKRLTNLRSRVAQLKADRLERRKAAKAADLAADKKYQRDRALLERKHELEMQKLAQKKQEKPSKAQETVDREYAKDYAEYKLSGGLAGAERNMKTIDNVISDLKKSDNLTGPVAGRMPDFVNPAAADLQDRVGGVIQQSLRETLGAQFTEKEGELFIRRGFNKNLDEQYNIDRLNEFRDYLQKAADAKEAAAKYYEKNGTMTGYEGPNPESVIMGFVEDNPEPKAANEVTRTTKGGRKAIFNAKTKEFIRWAE
jgi:hypothetical protein